MNRTKTLVAAAVLASSTSGLLVSTGASANASTTRDVHTSSGSCSRQADYTYRLSDSGYLLNKVHVRFNINSNRNNRDWTLKVYRSGHLVRTLRHQTGSSGNAEFNAYLFADDDARIKVYAKAGYGEHCTSIMRLEKAT